eukprot:6078113-Pleurochrysis_carterae.AAC.1
MARVHLDITGEREQVEVEGPVLRHERAEEGCDIGRHARAEGLKFLNAATAARISHRIGRAKNVTHMQLRLGGEKGRQGVQTLKGALSRVILSLIVRE